MIVSIQFLRALAALMVLGFHSAHMANQYGGYSFMFSNTGAAGVDLFFVISGFIISYVTRSGTHSTADFLMRRLIRIAPPYWFYTCVTVAILLALPAAFSRLKFDFGHVLMSYFFLLSFNNAHTVGTVLGVGWSVCYEAYFYLLFALFMQMPRTPALTGMAIVIGAGALLAGSVELPPFTSVIFSALPLEFLAGCLLAQWYLRGWKVPWQLALLAIVLGIGSAYAAGVEELVANAEDPWRVLYFGVPAFAVTAGFLALERDAGMTFPRWLVAIGDASYSLYLSHQFVLFAVGKAWVWFGLQQSLPAVALLLVASAFAILIGLLSYRWFELPVTLWLNRVWRNRHSVIVAAN